MYEHQVWMNGGPGASSLMGFFTELGPLLLNSRSFPGSPGNEGEWQPLKNPYAWSTEASLLVWEQPAGVGFSRCVAPPPCPIWNDTSSAAANLQVLLAFYAAHPADEQLGRRWISDNRGMSRAFWLLRCLPLSTVVLYPKISPTYPYL